MINEGSRIRMLLIATLESRVPLSAWLIAKCYGPERARVCVCAGVIDKHFTRSTEQAGKWLMPGQLGPRVRSILAPSASFTNEPVFCCYSWSPNSPSSIFQNLAPNRSECDRGKHRGTAMCGGQSTWPSTVGERWLRSRLRSKYTRLSSLLNDRWCQCWCSQPTDCGCKKWRQWRISMPGKCSSQTSNLIVLIFLFRLVLVAKTTPQFGPLPKWPYWVSLILPFLSL